MVNSSSSQPLPAIPRQTSVPALQELVRRLLAEREQDARRRRRNILSIGLVLSVVLHASLILYLAFVPRLMGGGKGSDPLILEFAVLADSPLSQSPELELQTPEATSPLPIDPLLGLDPIADAARQPPAQMLGAAAVGVPTLGGSGQGGADGIGSGAGTTTFFGISSRGSRFAFIVDRSGSMLRERRMEIAKRELARSIDSLPDYAHFHVVFFSSGLMQPEMQEGWMRARKTIVRPFLRWLDSVRAEGGTIPGPAFHSVFSLAVRPDVIFFMTDGEITGFTADDVALLNRRGKHVIINTIAFGDPTSQDLLQKIARQSGGVYRFVPSEGW